MRPDWDDDIAILSGENVSFAIETAGLGSRFAAAGIDFLLQLALYVAAMYVISFVGASVGGTGGASWLEALGTSFIYFVTFVIWWGYYFLFEWLFNGQTPGKRALGLRVVDTSGLPITLWGAFVRNALRAVDFLPVFYGIGALVAGVNSHNRRLGDLAAGTVVARERREAGQKLLSVSQAADVFLDSLRAVPLPATSAASTSAASVTLPRLSHEEWELLSGFLRRRTTMTPPARARLAVNLAARLSTKVGQAPYPGQEEAFLEAVARGAGSE